MDKQPGHRGLDVEDLDHGALARQEPAVVTELAAGLGVERRAVQDDLDVLPRIRDRHGRSIADESDDDRLGRRLTVADEFGHAAHVEDLAVGGRRDDPHLTLA